MQGAGNERQHDGFSAKMTPTRRTVFIAAPALLSLALWYGAPWSDASSPDRVSVVAPARAPAPARQQWFDTSLDGGAGALPFGNQVAMAGAADTPIYGRNGRAINFAGNSAAQVIDAHIAAARSGDVKAAYAVYQAESACANSDEPVADYQDPAEREQFVLQRERLRKLCIGVSPAQVQERLAFLTLAARAGDPQARVDFYLEGPNGMPLDSVADHSDPGLIQWKEDAVGYLKSAAGQCDQFALGLLSTAYDAGQLVERAPKVALAYSVAATLAHGVTPTKDQLQSRFGDQMSAQELDDGLQMGMQIGRASCK